MQSILDLNFLHLNFHFQEREDPNEESGSSFSGFWFLIWLSISQFHFLIFVLLFLAFLVFLAEIEYTSQQRDKNGNSIFIVHSCHFILPQSFDQALPQIDLLF